MATKKQIEELAEKTIDAYSSDRYRSWKSVIRVLLNHGYTERQVEAIVRSKWTRWAGDQHGGRYGQLPSDIVLAYAVKQGEAEVCGL